MRVETRVSPSMRASGLSYTSPTRETFAQKPFAAKAPSMFVNTIRPEIALNRSAFPHFEKNAKKSVPQVREMHVPLHKDLALKKPRTAQERHVDTLSGILKRGEWQILAKPVQRLTTHEVQKTAPVREKSLAKKVEPLSFSRTHEVSGRRIPFSENRIKNETTRPDRPILSPRNEQRLNKVRDELKKMSIVSPAQRKEILTNQYKNKLTEQKQNVLAELKAVLPQKTLEQSAQSQSVVKQQEERAKLAFVVHMPTLQRRFDRLAGIFNRLRKNTGRVEGIAGETIVTNVPEDHRLNSPIVRTHIDRGWEKAKEQLRGHVFSNVKQLAHAFGNISAKFPAVGVGMGEKVSKGYVAWLVNGKSTV